MTIQVEFICKCGEYKSWIKDELVLPPCPKCGRVYRGIYDSKKLTVKAVEVIGRK